MSNLGNTHTDDEGIEITCREPPPRTRNRMRADRISDTTEGKNARMSYVWDIRLASKHDTKLIETLVDSIHT